jgi:hypothetical protein
MDTSSLPFASIENDLLQLDYLTTIGPRVVRLYAKNVSGNLLAETPDVHWPTPHGEYYLPGGHRLWTAPEDPFYICPEDNIDVAVKNDGVILQGHIDGSGLEKEIYFHLDENCVILTHRIIWHGAKPIELAPWTITQMQLGGMAILPQPDSDGLLPNRNIVLWPYSHLNDQRLELHDDVILVYGHAAQQAFKIGNYNTHGWIAYAMDNVLFVKRFSIDQTNSYPDMGCNVETYVKDSCIELETLGPLTTLEPKGSITFKETWEVNVGKYPATLETARKISRYLSPKSN